MFFSVDINYLASAFPITISTLRYILKRIPNLGTIFYVNK